MLASLWFAKRALLALFCFLTKLGLVESAFAADEQSKEQILSKLTQDANVFLEAKDLTDITPSTRPSPVARQYQI
jgi:hypothetical protein